MDVIDLELCREIGVLHGAHRCVMLDHSNQ